MVGDFVVWIGDCGGDLYWRLVYYVYGGNLYYLGGVVLGFCG